MARDPQPFRKVASVTLNASGYGYCTITCPNGVTWRVLASAVSTTQGFAPSLTVPPPSVSVYADSAPNQSHWVEGTSSGNGATSDTVHNLIGGDALTAEWTAGVAGSLATFRIQGFQTQTAM